MSHSAGMTTLVSIAPPPTPAGQPYRDTSQVGVRAVRVLAPGDFVPRQPVLLTADFDCVHSSFRPTKIAAHAIVAAIYSAPGQPDVTRTHSLDELPDYFTMSEMMIDGVPVALPRKGCAGAGIAPPAIRRTIRVSWLVGSDLLDFLAERCGDMPDGYGATPRAVDVTIDTIFYGPVELPRREEPRH